MLIAALRLARLKKRTWRNRAKIQRSTISTAPYRSGSSLCQRRLSTLITAQLPVAQCSATHPFKAAVVARRATSGHSSVVVIRAQAHVDGRKSRISFTQPCSRQALGWRSRSMAGGRAPALQSRHCSCADNPFGNVDQWCCSVKINIGMSIRDPEKNFKVLWETFRKLYSFFQLRNVNWKRQHDTYRSKVTNTTSDDELFEIFCQMLDPLNDGHRIEGQASPHRKKRYFTPEKKPRFRQEFTTLTSVLKRRKKLFGRQLFREACGDSCAGCFATAGLGNSATSDPLSWKALVSGN